MADNAWLGGAPTSVAQVDRFTPANVEINDVFTLTVTGEDGSTVAVSFTATAGTVANVTAGLTAAWNASTNTLCTPISAADVTTSLTLTADTAGVPFSVASSTTDGGGANTQTLTRAVVAANAGPYDFNDVRNWLLRALPASSDTMTVDGRAANGILYSLNQSAIALAKFTQVDSFNYTIGTTGAPLRIGATSVVIGEPSPDGVAATGPSLVNLDTGTGQSTVRVIKTATRGSNGYPPFMWIGSHASGEVTNENGVIGIATHKPGATATVSVFNQTGANAKTEIGAGVTLTTLNQAPGAGSVVLRCAATTINQDAGGKIRTEGTGAITTVNAAGTFEGNSTGTITNLNVEGPGFGDFTKSTVARTITNAFIRGAQAKISTANGKAGSVTITNGVDCLAGAHTNQVNFGDNRTVTDSAP